MVFVVKLEREKSLRRSGRKHFLPCVHECSIPCGQEGIQLHECSKKWMSVNFLLLFTAVIKLFAFADYFVKQSDKQF